MVRGVDDPQDLIVDLSLRPRPRVVSRKGGLQKVQETFQPGGWLTTAEDEDPRGFLEQGRLEELKFEERGLGPFLGPQFNAGAVIVADDGDIDIAVADTLDADLRHGERRRWTSFVKVAVLFRHPDRKGRDRAEIVLVDRAIEVEQALPEGELLTAWVFEAGRKEHLGHRRPFRSAPSKGEARS